MIKVLHETNRAFDALVDCEEQHLSDQRHRALGISFCSATFVLFSGEGQTTLPKRAGMTAKKGFQVPCNRNTTFFHNI